MRKKNLFLALLAMVLVCAISVTGTMAYLVKTTDKVENTFIAAGGGRLVVDPTDDTKDGTFTLQEHIVTQNEDGTYTKGSTTTTAGNTYELLPGVNVPKDPYITINKKTEAPAYLYVEVVETGDFGTEEDDSDVSYALTESWTKLSVEGAHKGIVYVYKYTKDDAETSIVDETTFTNGNGTVEILADNQIVVGEELEITSPEGIKLDFYAYLGQASAGTTTAEVYTTCFGNN